MKYEGLSAVNVAPQLVNSPSDNNAFSLQPKYTLLLIMHTVQVLHTPSRLCRPDVVTYPGQASAVLQYWVIICPEGKQARSIGSLCTYYWQYIFHLRLFPFLALLCLHCLNFVSFSPSRCLFTQILQENSSSCPSEESVWRHRLGGELELQGTCIRGEGASLRRTHTASGEEGWGDEAQTACGGAVCRAPPAGPGQDLPAGWRRGICGQPTRPESVSQGQSASQLF